MYRSTGHKNDTILFFLQVLVFTAHQLTEENDLQSVITMDRQQILLGDLVKGADVSADKECGLAWIKMDVTPTVQTWLFNSEKNFGVRKMQISHKYKACIITRSFFLGVNRVFRLLQSPVYSEWRAPPTGHRLLHRAKSRPPSFRPR